MSNRRSFIKQSMASVAALSSMSIPTYLFGQSNAPLLSLAQWSLNRAFRAGDLKAVDFAEITRQTFQLDAVEYVAGFYQDRKNDSQFWAEMFLRSSDVGIKNLLIMVDDEGDLGNPDDQARKQAVENHYAWVDGAKELKCHSIRVNAFGTGERQTVKSALVDGMGQLCEYGAKAGINILIENHGLFSSEADFVVAVIKEVDSPYLGTLPDFGNWCTSQKWGATRDDSCEDTYGILRGVREFMPFAKGVSAKSYDFNDRGDQPRLDYIGLLQIVKDAGYDGYIGIEYEGENRSEYDGIRATRSLIEKVWAELN